MNKYLSGGSFFLLIAVFLGSRFASGDGPGPPRGHRVFDFIANAAQAEVVAETRYRPERKVWGDRFENTDEPFSYLSALPNLTLRFSEIEILPNARLHYGFGVNKLVIGELVGDVQFCIRLESKEHDQKTLVQELVTPVKAREPRSTGLVDLRAFAGETVSFLFTTTATDPDTTTWPAWFDLRLTSAGRPLRAEELDRSLRRVTVRFTELLDRAEVDREHPSSPVARATHRSEGQGGFVAKDGPVIAAAPPSLIRWQQEIPPSAILETWSALAATATEEQRGPVEFTIAIDGTTVARQICAPTKEDNLGGRELLRFDLKPYAGRSVELAFRTTDLRQQPGPPLPAGWIFPQLVQSETIRRQLHDDDAPSVVLICVDTLRADRLGIYGCTRGTSPNLDRFSQNAVVCDRVQAQSSWTLPSTASLLTGMYPNSHGVVNEQRTFLDDPLLSLPEALSQYGFTTAAFVSNLLLSKESNFHQGFETYQRMSWSNAKKVNHRFLNWLDNYGDFRFFAYLHYVDPHDPYQAPEPYREVIHSPGNEFAGLTDTETFAAMAKLLPDPPVASLENPVIAEGAQHLLDLYDSEIYYWDLCLGELLEELDKRDRLDSTIFVITSDHGEEFFEHSRLFHAQQLYEESIRVPLILKAPGVAPKRIAEPIEGVDVFPTILNLLGYPHDTQGRDFLNASERPVFSSTELGAEESTEAMVTKHSITSGPWKLISTPRIDKLELFHLKRDSKEQTNLVETEPGKRNALQSLLEQWLQNTTDESLKTWLQADPTVIEHMRELGYIDR